MSKTKFFERTDPWRRALCLLCILGMCSLSAFAQKRITGTVTDAAGEPVIAANIVEKGAKANGTITGADGKFTSGAGANVVLQVSCVGYVTQEIAVGNRKSPEVYHGKSLMKRQYRLMKFSISAVTF